MVDKKMLDRFGTTNGRLRQIFTAKAGSYDHDKIARPLMDLVRDRIQDGVSRCLRNYPFYAAPDLAWDGQAIQPLNISLLAYAQGRISISQCEGQLKELGCADKFIVESKTDDGKVKKSVDMLKLNEVVIGIARSFVTRRGATQANKYNGLQPFYKYEPRTMAMIGKLRGEAMSQYAEIMSDSYGYRHAQTQSVREILMYSHSIEFPACAWDRDTQPAEDENGRLISKIVREGIPFVTPHPTRVFHDPAHSLSTLNTDTGCEFIGFWDIAKFGSIYRNSSYFNRDAIKQSSRGGAWLTGNRAFWDLYFKDQAINFSRKVKSAMGSETPGSSLADANDKQSQASCLTTNDYDVSVFKTDFRMKLIPKEWKLGEYPAPVWMRLNVASDDTPISAEILPSRPAVYWGHNEHDNRVLNQSMMHELMPWQDQTSNIMTQTLMMMKHSLFRIIAVNRDVVPDDVYKEFKAMMEGERYYSHPHLLGFSAAKMEEQGFSLRDGIVTMVSDNRQLDAFINNSFRAIVQMLSIIERLMILSPQELGQVAPREITAQESSEIGGSTQAMAGALSDSIDEGRAAKKRIIYESAMVLASDEIRLPASQRFRRQTIEKAGFQVEGEDVDEQGQRVPGMTIIGTKKLLVHDYNFTTRDGSDRPSNLQAANTIVQMLYQVIPLVGANTLGKQRIYDMINEVFRHLGVFDVKLEVNEGEPDTMDQQPELTAQVQQLEQQLQQFAQQMQALAQQVEKSDTALAKKLSELAEALIPNPNQNGSAIQPQPV